MEKNINKEVIMIPKSYSLKFASWFTSSCLNSVRHHKYGANQITPQQLKYSSGDYKNLLFKEITEVFKREPELLQKKINELG